MSFSPNGSKEALQIRLNKSTCGLQEVVSACSFMQYSPKYFSPSPRAIFSTLVIATDQLPPGDVEAVVAGVHAKGGMYREGLTRDVTHLLVLGPTGDYRIYTG